MKVSFGNLVEIVSPSDIEFVVQTQTRFQYSIKSIDCSIWGGGIGKGEYES